MSFARLLFAALLSACAPIALAGGSDGAVGMVLDLQGSGQIKEGGAASKLQLLAYLKPQMQVTLDAGSKASLTLYATRTVYQFSGPAVVDVGKEKLNVLQGKQPITKAMQERLVVAAENVNVTPGAVRLRKIPRPVEISAPIKNGTLLNRRPTFSWSGDETANYMITIVDESSKEIAATKVKGTNWQLPADVTLVDGNTYHWTIALVSESGGRSFGDNGYFSIASKVEADTIADLRPAANASIEEWVLFATMLESRDLGGEAQEVWQAIYRRRPDLQKIRQSTH